MDLTPIKIALILRILRAENARNDDRITEAEKERNWYVAGVWDERRSQLREIITELERYNRETLNRIYSHHKNH